MIRLNVSQFFTDRRWLILEFDNIESSNRNRIQRPCDDDVILGLAHNIISHISHTCGMRMLMISHDAWQMAESSSKIISYTI